MKKTTIYLEEHELESLKQKAFLLNTSITELIRRGIHLISKPSSKDEASALKALAKIRKKTANIDSESIVNDVIETQREIRNEKKSKRRS